MKNNNLIKKQALELGSELVQTTIQNNKASSKYAIFIGEELHLAMNKYKKDFIIGHDIQFFKGDLKYPYGDGKAEYRIVVYSSNGKELLSIRLKYDRKKEKFHILGFKSA